MMHLQFSSPRFSPVLFLAALFSAGFALTICLPALAAAPAAQGGTLLRQNFDAPNAWPRCSAAASARVRASVSAGPVGTVDVAGSATPSGGLLLTALPGRPGPWSAALVSGLLPVRNSLKSPGLLTLSFSLSASIARPVTVRVESFNAALRRTGGLTGQIDPAAPDFYQRYSLDISRLTPSGTGAYQPNAPWVRFTFAIAETAQGAFSQPGETIQVRLDNVNYATPAYYVSPQGDDARDGRSERTAFATPQRALDLAQPGDIIDLMDGTYNAGQTPVAAFVRPGLPDAWIVLKNYPGQHPTLTSTGWNIVSLTKGSAASISHDPPLAYLEIRGLHIRGEGDVARQKYPDAMDKVDSRTNSNGIAVDCRGSARVFHDLRMADNLVEFCPGGGIGTDGDWVTVEDNVCRSNCWTTIYATSGISVAGAGNFDAQDNVYKRLVRNNVCSHNQTYEPWSDIRDYSDGNGIILDVNQGQDPHAGEIAHSTTRYLGRTLVQSNLSYDNGGSGIHAYRADRVDIINNTAYLNSASVHLHYPEISAINSNDVRIVNNILVAPVANVSAGEKPEIVTAPIGTNTGVVYSHNLYWGGNVAPVLGAGDAVSDPRFVHPSRAGSDADFHLRPDSPATGQGVKLFFSPILDLDGKPRHTLPALGAYER